MPGPPPGYLRRMRDRKAPAVPAVPQEARTGPPGARPIRPGKGRPVTGAGAPAASDYIPRLTPEEQARQLAAEEQTRKVRELAKTDPQAMSRLLRVWLAQGKSDSGAAEGSTPDKSGHT